jgi:hypothetical protein
MAALAATVFLPHGLDHKVNVLLLFSPDPALGVQHGKLATFLRIDDSNLPDAVIL